MIQLKATRLLLASFVSLLSGLPLGAQSFRQGNPIAVQDAPAGWSVDDAQGLVRAVVPVATLPGEIPVPLTLRINGSHQINAWNVSVIDDSGPRPLWIPDAAFTVDRPAWGSLNFGYMTTSRNFSWTQYSTATPGYYTEPGVTVLEDGRSYTDGDWMAWSSYAGSTSCTLASDFGFTNNTAPSVTSDGAEIKYQVTSTTKLGTWAGQLTGRVNGFTTQGNYWVVMDRGKARVFAYLQELQTWAPVLWVDRFGHSATFTWTRTVAGLPSGVNAAYSVVVDNRRPGSSSARGIQVQWATWTDTTAIQPLMRADFIGVDLPSIVVNGYSGQASGRPAGMSFPAQDPYSDNYIHLATPDPEIGGLNGRPASVQIGDRANLSQPAWALLPVPSAGPSAPTMTTQSWTFTWDANGAALTSMTAPNGLQAQLISSLDGGAPTPGSWSTHQTSGAVYLWRGDTLNETGSNGLGGTVEHEQVWTRSLPTTSTGNGANWSVTKQDWYPSQGASLKKWTFNFGPYTQPTAYSNAALASVLLQDATGTNTWMTVTNTLTNMGLDGLKTQVTGQSVAYPFTAEPSVMSGSTPDPDGLRIDQSVLTVGSANTLVKQVTPAYIGHPEKLALQFPSSLTTKLYSPTGSLLSPSGLQEYQYDGGSTFTLGEETKVFQQDPGSSGNQMGSVLTYDSEGRPSTRANFALNGGTAIPTGVSTTTLAYDATTGWPSSQTVTATSPSVSLTSTVLQRDTAGRPLQVQDVKGVVTSFTYDLLGRILSQSTQGKGTVTVAYNGDQLTRSITGAGGTTTQILDAFGRMVQQTDPLGTVTTTSYDVHGRVATQVQTPATTTGGQAARTTSWSYDLLDRPTSMTGPDGVTTTTAYAADTTGKLTVTTSTNTATGTKAIKTANALGQVISTQVLDGASTLKNTSYTYDGQGHAVTVTDKDAGGVTQTRTFTYDGWGHLIQKTEPETGTQVFGGFNALGQPTSIQEGVSGGTAFRTRALSYDGLGRLLSQANGPDNTTYTYTGAFLTSASATTSGWTVSQAFTYLPAANGAFLQTESSTQPDFSASLTYGYDANGQLSSLTYPDGRVVSYGRDALTRMSSVSQQPSGGSLTSVATVGYDPGWGFQSLLAFASGAQSVWSAQSDGMHLSKWRIQRSDGTALDQDRLYSYDASKDNLSQAGEWSLVHDHLGRLIGSTASTLGNYSATYGYDAFDNNITASLSGSTPPQAWSFSLSALPNNQVPPEILVGGYPAASGWEYNATGEATSTSGTPSGYLGLQWDGLGRMTQINSSGQVLENEGYAPSGMRVRRDDSVSANSRRYVYTSGGLLLAEYTPKSGGGWQWNRDVVYLGSQAIVEIDSAGTHELHSDHLGTPRVITMASGGTAVIEGRQNYGPYGETFSAMDSGYQPLTGYTGHVQTDPTGLIYMRGRFYTPIWHRFVNSDGGADSQELNQTTYVHGSPVSHTDPSGMIAAYYWDGSGINPYAGVFATIGWQFANEGFQMGLAPSGLLGTGPWAGGISNFEAGQIAGLSKFGWGMSLGRLQSIDFSGMNLTALFIDERGEGLITFSGPYSNLMQGYFESLLIGSYLYGDFKAYSIVSMALDLHGSINFREAFQDDYYSPSSNTVNIDLRLAIALGTTNGLQVIPFEIVIAHELGHAAGVLFQENDSTLGMTNVNVNENPVRWEFGLPSRINYSDFQFLAYVWDPLHYHYPF